MLAATLKARYWALMASIPQMTSVQPYFRFNIALLKQGQWLNEGQGKRLWFRNWIRIGIQKSPLHKFENLFTKPCITSQSCKFKTMHDFHSNVFPTSFHNFFTCTKEVHQYNTRLASEHFYYIPKVRTNSITLMFLASSHYPPRLAQLFVGSVSLY